MTKTILMILPSLCLLWVLGDGPRAQSINSRSPAIQKEQKEKSNKGRWYHLRKMRTPKRRSIA